MNFHDCPTLRNGKNFFLDRFPILKQIDQIWGNFLKHELNNNINFTTT